MGVDEQITLDTILSNHILLLAYVSYLLDG